MTKKGAKMIKVTCNTWEELVEFARKIVGEEAPAPAAKAPKAKTQKAAATAPMETLAPDPAPAVPQPEPEAPAKKAVAFQDVQTKAISLMDDGKQAQLQALLAKYGVEALPGLKDDQQKLEAFMADMEAL